MAAKHGNPPLKILPDTEALLQILRKAAGHAAAQSLSQNGILHIRCAEAVQNNYYVHTD
jgi:hypothetical protein